MDKEELKENIDKNPPEEELNTQSTENNNADQENEEKNLELKNCGDKGLSIGEKSKVDLENINIQIANIGVATKDSSVLNLKDDEILCHSTGLPYEMPHDWFAIGRTEPMNAYCGIYHHINEIIKQSIRMDGWWCNELHIKHHMNNNNIKVRHENLLVYGHKGQ